MTSFVSKKSHLTIRWAALLIALTTIVASLMQAANIRQVSADDGGYPWVGATCIDGTDCSSTYNWGYTLTNGQCPSADTSCLTYPYPSTPPYSAGMGDPWGYGVRNCTSYAAWKVNQTEGANVSGWGQAYQWATKAPSNEVHAASGYTPQIGDIAEWNATGSNPYGHVAYVYNVVNGVASLAEYNSGYPKNGSSFQWGLFYDGFTSANYPAGGPSNYIHVGTVSSASYDLNQFYVSNGSWTNADVSAATGVQIAGNPAPGSGGTWARDSNNHLRQFYVANGSWTAFDATNATGVSVSGDPATSTGGVWERDTSGHLREFYVSGSSWTSFDVSSATGVNIAGNPVVSSGGIYARDTNGHLRQFYVSGSSWTSFDVSAATGVSMYGDPALSSGGIWVKDTNAHLQQLYVSGSWTHFDVTNATGVSIYSNPVVDPNGGEWANDSNGHLQQFYIANGSWTHTDVSGATGITINGDPAVGNGGTWARGASGSLANHMLQFYVANGSWTYSDISGATSVNISLDPVVDPSGVMWAAS